MTVQSVGPPALGCGRETGSKGCCSALRWYMWPLVIGLDALGPFSVDTHMPNITQIEDDLRTTPMLAALALQQVNLISSAVACTTVGVLADRYGRRQVLLLSFLAYALGASAAALAPTLGALMVARVLMGCGQGAQVMAQVLMRDLVDDEASQLQVFAVVSAMQPAIVMTAPMLGGAIGGFIGWRWVFWLQALLVALAALAASRMRELRSSSLANPLLTGEDGSASCRALALKMGQLFSSKRFIGAVGTYSLMFMSISAMLTLVPFTASKYYGMSQAATGLLMGSTNAFLVLGGALLMLLSRWFGSLGILRVVMFPLLLAASICAALAWCYRASPLGVSLDACWLLMVPCSLLVTTTGVTAPTCRTLYLNIFSDLAGAAAGAAGLTMVGSMALGSVIGSAAWDGTPRSFYGTLAATMLTVQLWFWAVLGLGRSGAVAAAAGGGAGPGAVGDVAEGSA